MTVSRRDGKGTPFGEWVRTRDVLDSKLGYNFSDVDMMLYIWANDDIKKFMFIEEKTHSRAITNKQRVLFNYMNGYLLKSPRYYGIHLIQFENTSPDDGKIFLNYQQIKIYDLLEFMQFKKPKEWYFNG